MKQITAHISILLASGLLFALAVGDISGQDHTTRDLDCLECHTCPKPTAQDKCLKPCPTLQMPRAHAEHSIKDAPDTFVIGELSDLYQPVTFNHRLHADMAQMGASCETCHHYGPEDRIPPCSECHGGEQNPTNLRQPSLKGAYHRQCLGCHREWSHDTKCILCHLPVPGKTLSASGFDSTDILGISHPVITIPDTRVYVTPYEPGPIVTLHHKDHVELYGLRCVDCHQQENCSYCHDLQKENRVEKTQEEVHAVCNDCHLQDDCMKCHGHEEKPAFSHASTGWPLSHFHQSLDCRNCHPTGRKIGALNSDCKSCHAGWNSSNFDHARTGLQLDEIHSTFDCQDCHTDLAYNREPDCSACHDGVDYKETPPGEYIK